MDNFNWIDDDIIKLFNTFSEKEFTDYEILNYKLSKIDMSKETIKIKSTNTELREGVLLYNKNSLNLNLVIKDYIDGIKPTSNDITQIKHNLKDRVYMI